MGKDKQNTEESDLDMAKIKYVRPSKSQEKKAAAPVVPDPEPEPEPDTSPMSDVPLDLELNDDDFGFDNEEDKADEQDNEAMVGEGDGVEDVPEQAVDDMEIDWDDDGEEEAEETKEELLDQINKNWNISSLRSIMEPGFDEKNKTKLKDTWLSGKTDITDEEWDTNTLRLFRDLSRLTRNDFDDAKSRLAKTLRYRKHDEHGKRTGSQRVIKEPRLRNDLRTVISALHTKKRKERDEKDGESGKPKKKKKAKADESSDVDLDDDLYKSEEEISFEEYQKRMAKKKGSSKRPGGNSANRSKSRQDSEDESSSGPDEVPSTDPGTKRNAEAGVKVKKKRAPPKKNAQAKADAAEAEAADNETPANEPPPVTIIQNEEERNAALEYIYTTWRTTSLLHVLPDALHPVEATKDQDLAYEIVAALRNLSNFIRTPDELAAFRQDLEDQVAGDATFTNEDIVAHIMRVGEPYYHAARAAGGHARHPIVQSAAAQLQTEGPTTRRSPRNHNTSAIPPAGGQQAVAAPALDLLAAAATDRSRAIATTPQPSQIKQPPAAKPNAGNEGTAQPSEQRTTRGEAESVNARGQSSGANNTQGQVQPPQPQPQPAEQRPSRPTAAIRDNDITFRLVSALSRVRNSEADVRVAQIQRDIAALQGQSAYAQANASLEVALKERQRAEAEMEANSFQGNREGMQRRREVARQREEELRRIRRGDAVDAGGDEEGGEDGEPHQRNKRQKTGEGGKSGDEGDRSGEGNGDGGGN
ncbi:hypothetical protein J4E83_010832 [Alternaria metachromatica]|uniref:uncharacterized protein n=1 Tax=Alternaria metachromatica TaxID=283354 RepID=UPI0020C52ABE|nr:uncharacterized protein J4E83_010832 [Alternaria metachromatica]KAI4605097.1 hypothetical protein J4E83_010832 [Alternaria metachromatica]